jgi:NAD(P)-dependent dehydrogenase (short-subunit alcohol dehydrogenase family)
MDLYLNGKVAIVTGAASGIGRAIALLLAEEGVQVVAADINERGLEETCEQVQGQGGTATRDHLDVAQRSRWEEVVAHTESDLGPIDILCNVAGPGDRYGHLETTDEQWQRQIDGHLTGVFLGCQTVLPGMIDRRYGKIINMGSFTAHGIVATIPAYCAAFGGILAYTKDLARFAAPHNINVNCVSPGNIDTPMTRDGWLNQPGALESLRESMPIKRVGQPEDVAYWFAVLASDRVRHVVGTEINVFGGQLIA